MSDANGLMASFVRIPGDSQPHPFATFPSRKIGHGEQRFGIGEVSMKSFVEQYAGTYVIGADWTDNVL